MRMQRQTIILQSNIRKTIDYYNQMELAQIEIFGILQTMLSSRESTAHSPSVPMLERVSYVGGLDRWNRIANALKIGADQIYLMTDGVQYYLIQYSEDRYGENGIWEYVVDEWGYMIGYPG